MKQVLVGNDVTVGQGMSVRKSLRTAGLCTFFFPASAVVLMVLNNGGSFQIAFILALTAVCAAPYWIPSFGDSPLRAAHVVFLRESAVPRFMIAGGMSMLWAATTGTETSRMIIAMWIGFAIATELLGWLSSQRVSLEAMKRGARRNRLFREYKDHVEITALDLSLSAHPSKAEALTMRALFAVIVVLGGIGYMTVFGSRNHVSNASTVALLFGAVQIFMFATIRDGGLLRRAIREIERNGPAGWIPSSRNGSASKNIP